MNAQDIIAAGQGCAISIAFLFITWKLPEMLKSWITSKRDGERFQADEREKDRMARHESNNAAQKIIAEMYADHRADLKIVAESVCRYHQQSIAKGDRL